MNRKKKKQHHRREEAKEKYQRMKIARRKSFNREKA